MWCLNVCWSILILYFLFLLVYFVSELFKIYIYLWWSHLFSIAKVWTENLISAASCSAAVVSVNFLNTRLATSENKDRSLWRALNLGHIFWKINRPANNLIQNFWTVLHFLLGISHIFIGAKRAWKVGVQNENWRLI